ncbi:DNase I-like protein [Myriangium duriaei CBS 260.36]|uniref:DNase I-like protein n=1 Tax=Myriangium duriaei CBS 260.36 TaxID=1168546 RepID=A0A9P4IV24_9PEZI|nr:DNase I-like protein [Myriangium duriaei CBS 260.36]
MSSPHSISPPPLKRRRVVFSSPRDSAEAHDLRIFAWNVNGIAPFLQRPITSFFKTATSSIDSNQPRASLRDFLRRHGWPHLLLLQEVKIAPSDITTQQAVRAAVTAPKTSGEPDYQAFFTLPTDPHNARGFGRKVYGVCTIVRSDFVALQGAQMRTVDWDLEGRFSIVETEGLNGWPKLSIWNVYAVNGTDFDYRDSKTGESIGTRHDRKLMVHRLMAEECMRLEKKGYCVILAGDMNVARDRRDGYPRLRTKPEQHVKNRKDFAKWFFDDPEELRAIDTFRQLHEDKRRYTYYPRGVKWGESCDRVDYVICSRALKPYLIEAGMLDSEKERGPSDHVPVFADLSFVDDTTAIGIAKIDGEKG